eukprot:gnl/Carplike_NY0171/4263_a5768_301.p1 GENE.gnl/Carplike_NY0171/4263_a5768_301~~gnl/Carplike_NY0171/4263_a5768_301.p1  ORF type:complete len:355 (+),score=69.00 gnl/Carplike_NY0171/4263_a5768_301:98-1066(+)
MIVAPGGQFNSEDTSSADENTSEAIYNSVVAGIDSVQVDIRITRDKVPVLFRYSDLSYGSTCSGAVEDTNYEDLENCLTPKQKLFIPSFADAITQINAGISDGGENVTAISIVMNFPEKNEDVYNAVADVIKDADYDVQYFLAIFQDLDDIDSAKDLLPKRCSFQIYSDISFDSSFMDKISDDQVRGIVLDANGITFDFLTIAHRNGFSLWANNVSDEKIANQMIDLGVNGLISTNCQRTMETVESLRYYINSDDYSQSQGRTITLLVIVSIITAFAIAFLVISMINFFSASTEGKQNKIEIETETSPLVEQEKEVSGDEAV